MIPRATADETLFTAEAQRTQRGMASELHPDLGAVGSSLCGFPASFASPRWIKVSARRGLQPPPGGGR